MIGSAARLHGQLVEHAHAGAGLSRVQKRAASSFNRVDEPLRHSGDAASPLKEVQSRSLHRQQVSGGASDLGKDLA